MFIIKEKIKNLDFRLFIFVLSVLGMFMHGKLPYMLHLSITSTSYLVLDLFLKREISCLYQSFRDYIKNNWIYTLLVIYFIVFFLEDLNNGLLRKELIYSMYIFFILFIYFIYTHKRNNIEKINVFFSIGFLSLTLLLSFGFYFNVFFKSSWFGLSMNNKTDYNYLALAFLSAIMIILTYSHKITIIWHKVIALLLIIVYEIPILFLGSRRGLILLIVIQISLIIYLIKLFVFKKHNSLIRTYVGLLFILSIIVVLLFSFNSIAWKNYILDRVFIEKAEKIRKEYSKIRYRYASIGNSQKNFKELHESLWEPVPFNGKSVFDKIIFNKEKKQFLQHFEKEEFDRAYEKLVILAQFSESKEEFMDVLPIDYKGLNHINNLEETNFNKIPYRYTVPYFEKDFLTLVQVENTDLVKIPGDNHRTLEFRKHSGKAEISSYVLLLPNTSNEIHIEYSGIDSEDLVFSFNKLYSKKKIDFSDTIVRKDGDRILMSIIVLADSAQSGIYFWDLSLNTPKEKLFKIHSTSIKRTAINQSKLDSIDSRLSNRYLSAQKRKQFQFKKINKRYLVRNKVLEKQKLDSIKKFVKYYNNYEPTLRNYGRRSMMIESTSDMKYFQCPQGISFSRAYFQIPVISSGTYTVSFQFQSDKKPYVYVKRFPEVSPHFLKKTVLSQEINKIGKNLFNVNYQFKVLSTESALCGVVVGITNSEEGDVFGIGDIKTNIENLEDTAVSSFQYDYLKPYMDDVLFKQSILKEQKINIEKYKWFKETISEENSLFTSRIDRWRFALFYFKEQNNIKKIFGGGFKYLSFYPFIFNEVNEIKSYDYPHNPIISSFLYSGIVGGILYIYFLVLSFIKYWQNRKRLALFGLLYILTFIFTFFSGNSHFSVPAFALLSLVPFAYNQKNKKE